MKQVFRGNLVYTRVPEKFEFAENGYLAVKDGVVEYAGKKLPEKYREWVQIDYGNQLLIPGFVDLHLHASQYPNIGLGSDMELLPWLENYTFPEEAKYYDPEYAEKVYKALINRLWEVGTTRSVLFSTIHRDSTEKLADLVIESGLSAYVGKVNMDRNSPDYYIEDTRESLKDTEEFIRKYRERSPLVKPIVTPRFVPSCSEELMKGLGELAGKYNVPVQSHVNENQGEIEWVSSLHPSCDSYCDVYNRHSLFGDTPTLMAHCIYCSGEEISLMQEKEIIAVHCPHSNANLISGIMPVKDYLEKGIKTGLGSDISGGHTLFIPQVMVLAIQLSKMRALSLEKKDFHLSTSEVFYLGTKAGGSFFGKVGSFEKGYRADFLVVDDRKNLINELTLKERIDRFMYTGQPGDINWRYVEGTLVEKPFAD